MTEEEEQVVEVKNYPEALVPTLMKRKDMDFLARSFMFHDGGHIKNSKSRVTDLMSLTLSRPNKQ